LTCNLLRLTIQLLFDASHLADKRLDLLEQEIPPLAPSR
jgi:hypothetical protein